MLWKGLLNTNGTAGFSFIIVFPFFFFFFFFQFFQQDWNDWCFHRTTKLQLAKDGGTKLPVPLIVMFRWTALLRNFLVLTNWFKIISNRVVAKTIYKIGKLRIQPVVLYDKTQEQTLSSFIVLLLEKWILATWLASLWFEAAEGCRMPRYRHILSFIS